MSDLTAWVEADPADVRPMELSFLADSVLCHVHVFTDTDPTTYWREAASAVANSESTATTTSVELEVETGQVKIFDADGSVRTISVVMQ